MNTILLAMLIAVDLAGQEKPKDNWQRSKECAAQAERQIWDWKKNPKPPRDLVTNHSFGEIVEIHYSLKYQHCFAYVALPPGYVSDVNDLDQWYLVDLSVGETLATIIRNLSLDPKAWGAGRSGACYTTLTEIRFST